MRRILDWILYFFSVVTDWMLIVIGALLVGKSLLAVDVAAARYPIMGIGILIMGVGLWYRHRRKRR